MTVSADALAHDVYEANALVRVIHAAADQIVSLLPPLLIVAIVLYPHLDALVQPALGNAHANGAPVDHEPVVRVARVVWLYIGHLRYELPNLFADTLGQLFRFFPQGFYEEVHPYTREAREARNDALLLRLQRMKNEAEKLRVEEIHPEVLRRLIAQIDRWQWRRSRLSFIDNLLTSDEGRKAKRRFAFLARTSREQLETRLAEAEEYWSADIAEGPEEDDDAARVDKPAPRTARPARAAAVKAKIGRPPRLQRPTKAKRS
mmetsp:Transcript_3887/g.10058  ORF Transcript_3887/g.10058 Transcript_3887/m.10058 type:complete len:261 (+) Transcript_3887:124-906(+)|eukprot:CAMPEP_0119427024 /NCGR_PEP_ID=MMETSP1335-20130426/37437_1 /TAXON_ID=259385 /ORGANISM="Chrysoculter rhomboideus, Strain RCC1486" /LENGTH=260 /DNA_ID=CAMNT_0007452645 /DNA_START=9 /DNA_END=791 /DNA_ORIENTATION=+